MSKIKAIFCVLFGHSKIVKQCLGYIYCARCGDQLGDRWGGSFSLISSVIVGHNCPQCEENWKELTWKDKFLTPNPFKKEKI